MFGIFAVPPQPPKPTKYALVASVKSVAVMGDDWPDLQKKADAIQGLKVTVKLADGTELAIGNVDYTRVERA